MKIPQSRTERLLIGYNSHLKAVILATGGRYRARTMQGRYCFTVGPFTLWYLQNVKVRNVKLKKIYILGLKYKGNVTFVRL